MKWVNKSQFISTSEWDTFGCEINFYEHQQMLESSLVEHIIVNPELRLTNVWNSEISNNHFLFYS